jgi:hypothetical protein
MNYLAGDTAAPHAASACAFAQVSDTDGKVAKFTLAAVGV